MLKDAKHYARYIGLNVSRGNRLPFEKYLYFWHKCMKKNESKGCGVPIFLIPYTILLFSGKVFTLKVGGEL